MSKKKKKIKQKLKEGEKELVMENFKNQIHYQIVLIQNSIIYKNTLIYQKRINNIYIWRERERVNTFFERNKK